mgnify:CR=1 FL=1
MKRNLEYPALTTRQILDGLRRHHCYPISQGVRPAWVFVEEVRVTRGWMRFEINGTRFSPEQEIDAWAIHLWPSQKHKTVAYEVKTSRADFLRELAKPEKRRVAHALANQVYFAVPEYMVKRAEIPSDMGLIWVTKDGRVRTEVEAPSSPIASLPVGFWLSVCVRLGQNSAVRGAGQDDASMPRDLGNQERP